MSDRHRTGLTLIVALMLISVFLAQGWYFIRANSQTFDEGVHLTAGYSYWATGDFRLNPEHPPFIKLACALPLYLWYRVPFEPDAQRWAQARLGEDEAQWRISKDFLYGSAVPADDLLTLGRLPNLLLGAALVALVGWWAYRLWGRGAALVAMSLAALEPNLVANASLVTTDLSFTLFTCCTLYLLWEYSARPSPRLLAATGIALGLALGSKFSCLLLLGLIGVILATHIACGGSFGRSPSPAERSWPGLRIRLQEAAVPALRILCLAILVLVPLYFFQWRGIWTWTYGLRTQMNQQTTGKASFFLGEYSDSGWWDYFPVSFLIKTPLGSLLMVFAAIVLWRWGKRLQRREVVFLLLPTGLYLAALTQLRLNIGLRYALPIYPLLFVLASRLATLTFRSGWLAALALGGPVLFTAASVVHVAPHQLAYFNELIGGPEEGHRYLSNANIDWGQDLRGLKEFMDREQVPAVYLSYYGTAPPAHYGVRCQYLPGFGELEAPLSLPLAAEPKRTLLAISVVNLQGVHFVDRDRYGWLRRRTPIAKIGFSIFVYDLTGDADAQDQVSRLARNG
jgi:hypothetical protein